MSNPTWLGLTEAYPGPAADTAPPLDRGTTGRPLSDLQRQWVDRGYVILRGVLPDDDLDAYRRRWARDNGPDLDSLLDVVEDGRWLSVADLRRPGGYGITDYETVPEMRGLLCSPAIGAALGELFDGARFGLHLCLSGWTSTTRNWHQDDYLNPPAVRCWYAAAWVPLTTVDPAAGPFEVVPGSHRWGRLMRRDAVARYTDPGEMGADDWPRSTERFVTPAIETEMRARAAEPEYLYPDPGDVVIWHAALLHRGSVPEIADRLRPAVIGHYSTLDRADFSHVPLDASLDDGSIPYWRFRG